MPQQLEVEFRVYYTREVGAPRECIATRSVPHALQVWNDSVDAYSRSLELVISGDWLMRLLEQDGTGRDNEILDEIERSTIAGLCIKALTSSDPSQKQRYLEQVLDTLGYDVDGVRRGEE
jgi:hypothetical protein